MSKTLLIIAGIGVVIVAGYLLMGNRSPNVSVSPPNNQSSNQPTLTQTSPTAGSISTAQQHAFAQCLVEAGMVVYASRTCPACSAFAAQLGGYEVVDDLFVECSLSSLRCEAQMQTGYVPEIQINGVLYEGSRDVSSLANATGCESELNLLDD